MRLIREEMNRDTQARVPTRGQASAPAHHRLPQQHLGTSKSTFPGTWYLLVSFPIDRRASDQIFQVSVCPLGFGVHWPGPPSCCPRRAEHSSVPLGAGAQCSRALQRVLLSLHQPFPFPCTHFCPGAQAPGLRASIPPCGWAGSFHLKALTSLFA